MEYNISREEGRFSKYAFVVPTHNLVEVPESTDKVVDGLNSLMQELQHKYPYLRFLQKAARLEDGAVQRVYVYMRDNYLRWGLSLTVIIERVINTVLKIGITCGVRM